MIVVERSRLIPAPPELLWNLVVDPEALPRWFALAKRVEVLEGATEGRRQRLHGEWDGKASEVDVRIVEFEPLSRLGWRHEAERLDGAPAPRFSRSTHFRIDLAPLRGGTVVTLRSAQEPASFWKGLLMRLFARRMLGRAYDRSLARLESLVQES